jgi:hypothetical protein
MANISHREGADTPSMANVGHQESDGKFSSLLMADIIHQGRSVMGSQTGPVSVSGEELWPAQDMASCQILEHWKAHDALCLIRDLNDTHDALQSEAHPNGRQIDTQAEMQAGR